MSWHQVCECKGCPGDCGCGGLDPDSRPLTCGCKDQREAQGFCCPKQMHAQNETLVSFFRGILSRVREITER